MAIHFTQFASTPATLIADVKAAILGSSDWSEHNLDAKSTTTTASIGSYSTDVDVVSTAGLVVGGFVIVGTLVHTVAAITSATRFRTVDYVSTGSSIPSGTTVRFSGDALKTTTTDGETYVLNILGMVNNNGLILTNTRGYASSSATSAIDPKVTALFWKPWNYQPAAPSNSPLYVTVSVGKDHLYLSVEGPRPTETGAVHTNEGTAKGYHFMSALTRYHDVDVPTVVIGGSTPYQLHQNHAYGIGTTTQHHVVLASRAALTATARWMTGLLATLVHPGWQNNNALPMENLKRTSAIDGSEYLLPYVLFDHTEGMRGRLSRIFFTGYTNSAMGSHMESADRYVDYGNVRYVVITASRGDSGNTINGAFGGMQNNGALAVRASLIAVPYSGLA